MSYMSYMNRSLSNRSYNYHISKCCIFFLSVILLFPLCLCTFIGCHQRIGDTGQIIEKQGTPPAWVIHRRDARYPHTFYLIGIGVSHKDSAAADERARIDLLKQIEMEITSEEAFFQLEAGEKRNGDYTCTQESKIESSIKTKIDIKISGLTISERWHDEKEKKYYSLATLDRDIARKALLTEINNEIKTIHNLYSSGLEYEGEKDIVHALINYQKAYAKRDILDKLLQRYLVLRKQPEPEAEGPEGKIQHSVKPLSEIEKRLNYLISRIKIICVDGDNQKVFPGDAPAKKLVAKVVFIEKKKNYPVAGVPIKFSFDSATGQMDAEVITDANGIAASKVYRIDKAENKANSISAVIHLEGLTALREKKAVFTYYLPIQFPGELKKQSWYEGIVKLVEGIISQIYDNGVIKVAVLDFVEARSEQRLILSKIIESDLRTTLAEVQDLIVIDTKDEKDNTKGLRERARDLKADFYLSGVYWLYDKGLRVNAKLVDIEERALIATARAFIAGEAINSDDLNPFIPKNLKEVKVATTYDTNSSYDLAVDKLYFSEQKDNSFTINIWTDQKEYLIGDSLAIYVKSDKDCYLNLLDIGTSGKLTVLFPNSLHEDNFIKANRTYSIPYDFGGFSIEVLGPAGIERIKAIATLKPFSLVDEELPSYVFLPLERDNIGGLGGMVKNMEALSSLTWVQDFTEVRIYQKGEDRTRKTRSIKGIKLPDKPQPPIDIIGTPGVSEKKALEDEELEDEKRK